MMRPLLSVVFVLFSATWLAAAEVIRPKVVVVAMFEAGADCLTLGNHAWDQREAIAYIERAPRLLRAANYPPLTMAPGRGANLFQMGGRNVLVVTVMGRVFMDALDCPFSAV
eukprot:gene9896-12144_t